MFRFGRLIEDETFAPRTTQWVETGMNYYPGQRSEDPNAVRFTLQYTGENRITEQENAHGVVALIQLVWRRASDSFRCRRSCRVGFGIMGGLMQKARSRNAALH